MQWRSARARCSRRVSAAQRWRWVVVFGSLEGRQCPWNIISVSESGSSETGLGGVIYEGMDITVQLVVEVVALTLCRGRAYSGVGRGI